MFVVSLVGYVHNNGNNNMNSAENGREMFAVGRQVYIQARAMCLQDSNLSTIKKSITAKPFFFAKQEKKSVVLILLPHTQGSYSSAWNEMMMQGYSFIL